MQFFSKSLTFLPFLLPTTAAAQNYIEVLTQCETAIEQSDNVSLINAADQIRTWTNLFNDSYQDRGEKCLEAATGEPWIYTRQINAFSPLSQIRAAQEAAELNRQEAERNAEIEEERRIEELNQRRCSILTDLPPLIEKMQELEQLRVEYETYKQASIIRAKMETLAACRDFYEVDSSSALLNPVCSLSFAEFGLSDTIQNSYAPLELEMTKELVLNLQAQLEFISRTDRLPEDLLEEELQRERRQLIRSLPAELRPEAEQLSIWELRKLPLELELANCG